jgi:serine/threonine protein kinase
MARSADEKVGLRMQPDRWLKIERLFADALPLNGREREAFLRDSCGADQDLLREIRDLLTAHEHPTSLLDNPIFDLGLQLLEGSTLPNRRGEVLGNRFELRQVIGRGGMGEVYAAYDRERGQVVALKFISPAFALDDEHIARFRKEARAASLISHANVAAMHEIAHINGENIMAMELVDGRNLRQHMAEIGGIDEILNIAIGVSRALVAAHSAGVVHRDIKPENIMVEPNGNVKVLDFGLAKLVEPFVVDEAGSQINGNARVTAALSTEIGMLMGTTNYMSPEQIRGEQVDTQTDIWSLGVVLYELLVGSCPFQGRTKIDVIASILTAEPRKLPRHFTASKAINALLHRALHKDKVLRYGGADEILTDLENIKTEVVRDSQKVAARIIGIPRWGWVASTGVAVLLLALLGLLPSTRAAIRNYFIPRSRAPISALPAINDALVAYWPGDGTAEDLVAGNDGTLLNGTGYRPGVKGQAFSFDGLDDLMDASAAGLPTGSAPRTLTLWAYIDEYRGRLSTFGRWGEGPPNRRCTALGLPENFRPSEEAWRTTPPMIRSRKGVGIT